MIRALFKFEYTQLLFAVGLLASSNLAFSRTVDGMPQLSTVVMQPYRFSTENMGVPTPNPQPLTHLPAHDSIDATDWQAQKTPYVEYEYAANSSSNWLVPLTAYDDHRFTYIRFKKSASIPAIFGRTTEQGEDYLLNSMIQNDSVVKIQGVHAYLVLRFGDNVVGLRRSVAP